MSAPDNSPDSATIKTLFKKRLKLFYLSNVVVLCAIGWVLYYADQNGWYQQAFVPLTVIFLLWIFNADKLRSCPHCGGKTRGKQGLLYMPRQCASCGIELR